MKPSMILSSNAAPGRGGQGLNLQHMIAGLGDAFNLSVYSQSSAGSGSSHAIAPSRIAADFPRIPVVRRLRDWQTLIGDTTFDRRVAEKLTPADLFQGVTGQCLSSLLRARKLGSRLVLDVVTTHVNDFAAQQDRECSLFGIRPATHPRLRRRMIREYEAADLIRVMSPHAKRTMVENGVDSEKILVVPPPLSLEEFFPASFDDSIFRVCYVGLLEPWKGFHYLVEAFAALNLPHSALDLWGGPGSRPVSRYIREWMARNPSINLKRGDVRSTGYAEVYGKSSVLVSPSLADGFSYVVGEAMASGIPVIVTDTTGAADIVVDGVSGYIIPPRDRDALADRLLHLSRNPALVRSMGRAARESAMQLTLDAFRTRYIPRLTSLLA